jgi:hypothetical protein
MPPKQHIKPAHDFMLSVPFFLPQLRQSGRRFPDPSLADNFVEVIDGEFVLGCDLFPISGWNSWEMVEAGAGVPVLAGATLPEGSTGPMVSTISYITEI